MVMRMNQQHHQRQNGFVARQKYSENNGQQRQQQQQSAPKQEFKPVAILKRGDPSGTTIVNNKDDSQSKENISANGQQTKPINSLHITGTQKYLQPLPKCNPAKLIHLNL